MKKIILSDHKLNLLVEDVTTQLRNAQPLKGGMITGAEIMDFAPHKQVGQFLLFRIYQDATQFVGQLQHPSFDFGSPEVKEDLRRFLATLSRNIRLQERDFAALLQQAVYNTIKLILNPQDSICNFFFGSAEQIPLEVYRKHAPYFTDYDFIIRSILAWHEKQGLTRVERDVFLDKFERVIDLYEQKEGKSLNEYQRGLFLALTGQELERVVASAPPVIRTESAAPQILEQPPVEKKPADPPRDTPVLKQPDPPKEDGNKRPPISIKIKDKDAPQAPEPPKDEPFIDRSPKTTVPPWVEQKTPPPPVEEDKTVKSVFAVNATPPRSETPPWVEKKTDAPKEAIILDPITPLDEPEPPVVQQPVSPVEQPSFQQQPIVTPQVQEPVLPPVTPLTPITPTADTQERKTLHGSIQGGEEKRSLNDRFSQPKDKPSILERNLGSPEKVEEKGPATILDRFKQKEEQEPSSPVESPLSLTPPPVTPEPPKAHEPPLEETPPIAVQPPVEMAAPVEPADPPQDPPAAQDSPRTVNTPNPESRTLADRLKESQGGSGAETVGSKNIRTEQIPVHKQFQFVQKVFGGSSVKFKVILDKINKTQSLADAEEVLEKYVFNDPQVNREDKVAKEFEQLVRARFE